MPHKDPEARRAYAREYERTHPKPNTPERRARRAAYMRAYDAKRRQDPEYVARQNEYERSRRAKRIIYNRERRARIRAAFLAANPPLRLPPPSEPWIPSPVNATNSPPPPKPTAYLCNLNHSFPNKRAADACTRKHRKVEA